MKKPKILLFIPAYNCEKQIVRVLDQLDAETMSYIQEVLVINNRSTDGTEGAAMEWMKKHKEQPVVLLRNSDNYGLGGSHKVAFRYALDKGYDYIAILHGDDQGDIHDILPLLRSGKYRAYDCCLGARFMKGSVREGYSRFRTFGNIVYNKLFSIGCGFSVKDLGSGLNLYSADILKKNYYKKFPDSLMFNYCMIMAIRSYHQKSMFFPISWREDDQVSNVKLFRQAKRVIAMLLGYITKQRLFIQSELREKPVVGYTAQIIYRNGIQNE